MVRRTHSPRGSLLRIRKRCFESSRHGRSRHSVPPPRFARSCTVFLYGNLLGYGRSARYLSPLLCPRPPQHTLSHGLHTAFWYCGFLPSLLDELLFRVPAGNVAAQIALEAPPLHQYGVELWSRRTRESAGTLIKEAHSRQSPPAGLPPCWQRGSDSSNQLSGGRGSVCPSSPCRRRRPSSGLRQ